MTETVARLPEVKLRVGALAAGIGGFPIGFKKGGGEYMGVRFVWEIVAGVDVDPLRCQQFERLVGAPCYPIDLFSRRDYLAYHGEFRDLQDARPDVLRELLNEAVRYTPDRDGLVDLEAMGLGWGRYWQYDGIWAEVVQWSPPPPDWEEAGADTMQRVFGETAPDIFTISTPCQGNSRLLSEAKAATFAYRALNNLTPRAMYLCMLAWPASPPPVILNENVPGIKLRSMPQLRAMEREAKSLNYRTHFSDHDAGDLGRLAQERKRHMWIQCHEPSCPQYIYKPRPRGKKPIKAVIYPLPFPGHPKGGPLHERPNLEFITQLRLSLIPPGGDWKDIPGPGEWRLLTIDGREIPPEAYCKPNIDKSGKRAYKWFAPDPTVWGRIWLTELKPGAKHAGDPRIQHRPMGNGKGAYLCQDPGRPSLTITSDPSHRKSGGASTVAEERLSVDARCQSEGRQFDNSYGVNPTDKPSHCVTSGTSPSTGKQSLSDDRVQVDARCPEKDGRHGSHYKVPDPDGVAGTATGADHIANGAQAMPDGRLSWQGNQYSAKYPVYDPNGPARTVIGSDRLGSGAPSGSDERLELRLPPSDTRHGVKYLIQPLDEPANTVTTQADVQTGAPLIPDGRLEFHSRDCAYGVGDPDRSSRVVTGSTSVTSSNGPGAMADPRVGLESPKFSHAYEITHPDGASDAVASGTGPSNGGISMPDGRLQRNPRGGILGVEDPDQVSKTVTTHTDANGDAIQTADKRVNVQLGCEPRNGTNGVLADDEPGTAVIGVLDVHTGKAAMRDGRVTVQGTEWPRVVCTVEWTGPEPVTIASLLDDGTVVTHYWPDWYPSYFIISPWNAWHRALTDLELAVLQGFDAFDEEGNPFYLEGSRKDRRQAIGNAVPPPAAQAIAEAIGPTLVVAKLFKDAFLLSPTGEGIWVQPKEATEEAPVLQ